MSELPVSDTWIRSALEVPRACGDPVGAGTLRSEPDDFVVEEDLGFPPSGGGQHVLLKVRKRDANTQWVARELSRIGRCRPMDVGYAGLKDRRAVAIQWFTVPRGSGAPESWSTVAGPDFEVLEAHAHGRKLPRGALAGNRFRIRIRDVIAADEQIAGRMRLIASHGVPNYFGPQRFGRDGSNLVRLAGGLQGLRQPERGFALSAGRSLIFNAVLAERVREGSWGRLEAGDLANLDGRGSFFRVEALDATLPERCDRFDIHPTGPLWGRGSPGTAGRILQLESRVAGTLQPVPRMLEEEGLEQERRSLRIAVRDLEWRREPGSVVMSFRLARGSFATTVLREIFECGAADAPEVES